TFSTRRTGNATRGSRSAILMTPRRNASSNPGNETEAEGRQRAQFGSLIAAISASFVGVPVNSIDAAIEGALRQTVEALGVDHGAFYQSSGNGLMIAHRWPAENFETISNTRQADNLTWLADCLRRKTVLVLSQPEDRSAEKGQEEFLSRIG